MRRIALLAVVCLCPSPLMATGESPPPVDAAAVAPAHGIRPGMSVAQVRRLMHGVPRESGADRFGIYDRFATGVVVYYQLGPVDRTGDARDAEFSVRWVTRWER